MAATSPLGDSMTQEVALDVLESGHNCFVTGPPGAGKSWLLRKFIEQARETKRVAVTASTGIAGTHIGGTTLHSWAGLGVRDEYGAKTIADIARQSWLAKRINAIDILLIDEISMLHPTTFAAADAVCRKIRRNAAPFGGIQVVLCGDFFQLPPVSRSNDVGFVYGTDTWNSLAPAVLYLSGQFRQTDDSLLGVLNAIRAADVTEHHWQQLRQRLNATFDSDTVVTRLHTHNVNVDRVNQSQLDQLSGPAKRFDMQSTGAAKVAEVLKKGCLAPELLHLKVGAAVMFVKNNTQEGYVNGTLGTVEDFEAGFPVVRTNTGKQMIVKPQTWSNDDAEGSSVAAISQIPLRLAWAISVHKSQGMSLPAAEMDLSRSFVEGLGYVALSRLTSMSGVRLLGINRNALAVSDRAMQIDDELRASSDEVLDGKLPNPRNGPTEMLQLF